MPEFKREAQLAAGPDCDMPVAMVTEVSQPMVTKVLYASVRGSLENVHKIKSERMRA